MTDMPTLTTARLKMRPLTLSDADDLFSIRGDKDAMKHWDSPHDKQVTDTSAIVEMILTEMRTRTALYWTAWTSDGAFAGIFDLSELDEHIPDLGFMVPRRIWGRGFGFEGASALVIEAWRHGFAALKARIHDGNDRSARLLTKLGFVEVGAAAPYQVHRGANVICRQFRLLRSDAVSR